MFPVKSLESILIGIVTALALLTSGYYLVTYFAEYFIVTGYTLVVLGTLTAIGTAMFALVPSYVIKSGAEISFRDDLSIEYDRDVINL
jgi:hypothetical protein